MACGIAVAIIPKPAVNQPHEMRIFAAHGAGLVRREQNLGAAQRRDADVLDEVAVVTNQHADAKTLR